MKGTLPRSRTKKILIKSLNTGKSDDIFNIKAEHFVHANDAVAPVLSTLFNAMKEMGRVPDCMKLGVLTPVFKRKGSNLDAKNYRGKTITPTIAKILESVLRERIKKVREKSRECHNHKPQPFPDPKRKRKPTNPNKHKSNKRTKSTKISSLFPKRGNRNTKRTEKHKNKMTHGKTYNKRLVE